MRYNLFDTLLEPVFIFDENQIVIYCNEAASLICESTVRKILRSKSLFKNLIIFSHSDEFEKFQSIVEPTPYKELHFKNLNNTEGKSQITIQPIDSDSQFPSRNSWIVFFRDVTLEERLQKKYHAELDQKENYISELKKAQKQLEIYSQKLEALVEERTREIIELNKMMKALLDSLHSAFFMFNSEGVCLPVFSKSCLSILEQNPAKKNIWNVLNLSEHETEIFKKWMLTLFSEMLPFEDLCTLGPSRRVHSQGKEISIEYFPLRNEETQIQEIVCVANDITDLIVAKKQAQMDRAKVDSILKMIQNRNQLELFFIETLKSFENTLSLLDHSSENFDWESIYRFLHTLKGGAATFSYLDLQSAAHDSESLLSNLKIDRTEQKLVVFKNSVSSLKNLFLETLSQYESIFGVLKNSQSTFLNVKLDDFKKLIQENRNTELIEQLERTYLFEKISTHTQLYPQILEKTAHILNKKISPLFLKGSELSIPKNRFDYFFQVFIHALRNSVDHGIESEKVRVNSGKDPQGQIELTFSLDKNNSKDFLVIELKDDGQGIDPELIRKKLHKSGSPKASLPDEDIIYCVFDSDFSTKGHVDEISGRGIGLNAIYAEVSRLGGRIHIQTTPGKNCIFKFSIPLRDAQNKPVQTTPLKTKTAA